MSKKPSEETWDKAKCYKCKYHTYMGNLADNRKPYDKLSSFERGNIACYRSVIANQSCLVAVGRKVIDRRGDDYKNCKLYEPATEPRVSDFGKWVGNYDKKRSI
jgi:hypothetical protein